MALVTACVGGLGRASARSGGEGRRTWCGRGPRTRCAKPSETRRRGRGGPRRRGRHGRSGVPQGLSSRGHRAVRPPRHRRGQRRRPAPGRSSPRYVDDEAMWRRSRRTCSAACGLARAWCPSDGRRVGPDVLHRVVFGRPAAVREVWRFQHGADGLRAWAKTAAADLRGSGVTLNLAARDPITPLTASSSSASARGTMGDPADFGKVVAFLCSVPPAYVNGATIVVDGGATLAF